MLILNYTLVQYSAAGKPGKPIMKHHAYRAEGTSLLLKSIARLTIQSGAPDR
jgi:hypothetical protein